MPYMNPIVSDLVHYCFFQGKHNFNKKDPKIFNPNGTFEKPQIPWPMVALTCTIVSAPQSLSSIFSPPSLFDYYSL